MNHTVTILLLLKRFLALYLSDLFILYVVFIMVLVMFFILGHNYQYDYERPPAPPEIPALAVKQHKPPEKFVPPEGLEIPDGMEVVRIHLFVLTFSLFSQFWVI